MWVYSVIWGHAKRGVMWGGNQMLDEWFQGEFGFGRSGVRVSGGSVSWATSGLHGGVGGYSIRSNVGARFVVNVGAVAWGWILGLGIVVRGPWGVVGALEVIGFGRVWSWWRRGARGLHA